MSICIMCSNRIVNSDLPLCQSCIDKLTSNLLRNRFSDFCNYCGYPLLDPYYICPECNAATISTYIDRLFFYEDQMKILIKRYKFNNEKVISEILYYFLKLHLEKVDPEKMRVYTSVPGNPKNIKKRGWDQMEEIMNLMVKDGYTCIKLFEKKKGVNEQKKLSKIERVKGDGLGLDLNKIGLQKLSSKSVKKIIIIDDITTTGTTIQTCNSLLSACNYMNNQGLVIAMD